MRLAWLFVLPLWLPAAFVSAQPGDAAAVLAASRAALGGDARLAAVKTLVITGRTRQIQGDNLIPIEFEIACELPDRCVRRDEVPARGTGPTLLGFAGGGLVLSPAPPQPPPPSRLAAIQQDFVRLWLGLFAASLPSQPVTFTYAAQAEAPQGRADVLDATGADGFSARLFILRDTHLPTLLTWAGPPAGKADNRLYYGDHREVDGLTLPFRIRRAVGADTTEETTVDRFRINGRVDRRRFEVRP